MQEELDWLRAPKGAKKGKKAKEEKYEQLLEQSQTEPFATGTISIPPGPRLGIIFIFKTDTMLLTNLTGNIVLEVKNISKVVEDKVLFQNLSFTVPRASIVGTSAFQST